MKAWNSRDLSSIIQDLQRREIPTDSRFPFVGILQSFAAKRYAAVNKRNHTSKEKLTQISLVNSVAIKSLLTVVEPRIGQILHACDANDTVNAISRTECKLQDNHFETQKFSNLRDGQQPIRKPSACLVGDSPKNAN